MLQVTFGVKQLQKVETSVIHCFKPKQNFVQYQILYGSFEQSSGLI